MTTHTETQAMCERLRESAVRTQAAQQWMADAKSERNRAAGDEGASYSGGTKEMTLEWQAAALLTRQQEEIGRLREALKCMVYETTSLSPLEDDGSHKCRITKACLARARAALQAKP